jgi:integrase
MSVSKRNGSKYFYIQFQYNGRTYIKSSKTPDKQLALNLEAQWRKQLIEQNQLGLKSPIEITKGFQLFVKSKSHIKSIKYTIHWCDKASNHFKHLVYVHQITTIEVDRFRQLLQSNNYSNQSIKHVMNQVGGMIKYMRKLGYQVSEVEMPSIKLPKGRLRYLSTEEEQRLLKAADPTREIKYVAPYDIRRVDIKNQMQDFYDLLILLLDTGARHGEICSLEWSKIDLEQRTIQLWRSKVNNESVLYMTDRVHDVLTRRFESRVNQFIFTNKKGLARGSLTKIFKKAFDRAGIEGCSAHTLRHTHATRLIQNGMNLYEVKEILGHSDIKTTMRYAHIEQSKITQRAMNVINKLNISALNDSQSQ